MPRLRHDPEAQAAFALGALLLATPVAAADGVVLHLKGGDRVAGVVLQETTNSITLSNTWSASLIVPLTAIERREAPPTAPTNAAPLVAATVPPAAVVTNTPPVPAPALATAQPVPPKPTQPKRWKANLNFGAGAVVGTGESQNLFGSGQLTYAVPYRQSPERYFRATVNANGTYGEANGVVNANQVVGSVKTDFDIGRNFFAYNLGGGGYDTVRDIDLQWEVGPGMGWRAVQQPRKALDLEMGGQYLVRKLSNGPDTQSVFLRFADNFTWQLAERVTLKQTFAYLPQSTDFSEYRLRFDATMSFGVLNNLSLNLIVANIFDSNPAPGIERNQLQIRSTIGLNF